MLPIPPTRNLHDPHAATQHRHGRTVSRHRGAAKSVAPTDFSTSLWRITHRTRPNRLCGSGVRCVRCLQGCVRYFEIILHSWNIWISTCYAQKVQDGSKSTRTLLQEGWRGGGGKYLCQVCNRILIHFTIRTLGRLPDFVEVMIWQLCHLQRFAMNCVQNNPLQWR